jgi:Holliday junction resolvasome RuvABC endonuclease subunit
MAKQPWTPLQLADLPNGRFVAADPSLAAFGLVFIEIDGGEVAVREAQKITTAQTEVGGWESNFARADELYDILWGILDSWDDEWDFESALFVHEAPPSGGGAMMRTESSILAGREFRRVAKDLTVLLDKLVTPQSHKKLLCGNHIAKKIQHHKAIKELLPQIHDSRLITNEATRDALSIGLYAAHRSNGA